jgi:hypothetical protein
MLRWELFSMVYVLELLCGYSWFIEELRSVLTVTSERANLTVSCYSEYYSAY